MPNCYVTSCPDKSSNADESYRSTGTMNTAPFSDLHLHPHVDHDRDSHLDVGERHIERTRSRTAPHPTATERGDVSSTGQSALDDSELVRRVVSGEVRLFAAIVRRHNARLFRVARAIVGNDDEAEDVMQQAYLNAFASLRSFEGRALLSTWLTRITANEANARLRQRGRIVSTLDEDDPRWEHGHRSESHSPERATATRELGRILERAVDELPPSYRAILVLRDVEELSTVDAADCLGISEESARVRLHRARAALREKLTGCINPADREIYAFHLSRCDRVVACVMADIVR